MAHVYWMEIKSEFLKLARMKAYSVSTVMFPLMFYCFFGLAMGREPQAGAAMPFARYLLASYGAFAIIGATLYFLVVLPVNTLMAKFRPKVVAAPTTKPCPECLSDIPVAAKRCSHCAQLVA